MTVDEALAAADAFAVRCRELGVDPDSQVGNVLAAEVRRLREAVEVGRECANDLATLLDHAYEFRERYPFLQSAYDNDMAPVRRFFKLAGDTPCEQ